MKNRCSGVKPSISCFGPAVPLQRALQRVVSGEDAAEVGDVLAERQLAVHVDRVDLDVAVELIDDLLRFFRELERVGRRPPIAQVSLRVVVAALVVEAVRELVPRPTAAQ